MYKLLKREKHRKLNEEKVEHELYQLLILYKHMELIVSISYPILQLLQNKLTYYVYYALLWFPYEILLF